MNYLNYQYIKFLWNGEVTLNKSNHDAPFMGHVYLELRSSLFLLDHWDGTSKQCACELPSLLSVTALVPFGDYLGGKKVTSAYNFVSCLFFLAEGYLMDSLTCQIIWLLSVSIISTNFSSPLFLLTEKFWCLVCLAFLTLHIYLKYPGLFPFLQSLFPLPSPSFSAPWFSSLFQNYWEGS